MKIKQLKESTLKSYTVEQLAKHLDRVVSCSDFTTFDGDQLYRVDFSYNSIYQLQESEDKLSYYSYYCDITRFNKEDITSAIKDTYLKQHVKH
jgi:hypothetical protein